jgi:hypothetical protein
MLIVSVLALLANCKKAERMDSPPAPAPAPAGSAAGSAEPAKTVPAAAPDAVPAVVDAPLTGPASPSGIEQIAAGTLDLSPMVQPRMAVIEVIGAAEDASGRTKGTPRKVIDHCGDKAKAAIIATAKRMVERAKKYGNEIECDHQFVSTPDPNFAAVPATAKGGGRPAHPWMYAVCTQAGVAEYDRTLQLYFAAPSMHIVGILDTEVGSSLADEDLATLDGALTAEIVRCAK